MQMKKVVNERKDISPEEIIYILARGEKIEQEIITRGQYQDDFEEIKNAVGFLKFREYSDSKTTDVEVRLEYEDLICIINACVNLYKKQKEYIEELRIENGVLKNGK